VAVCEPAILAEKIADLSCTNANVPSWNVSVLTEVPIELAHKALAKSHDLKVGFTVGIEVGASLGSSDSLSGESVLEDLLEAEKFDDAEVHARMKTQATLVRSERRVELHPESPVDTNGACVINPGNPEHDLSFWLYKPVEHTAFEELWVLGYDRGD
jgi:hypothetical protein